MLDPLCLAAEGGRSVCGVAGGSVFDVFVRALNLWE